VEKINLGSLCKLKSTGLQTRQFRIVETLFFKNKPVATIQRNPHSNIIDPLTILVKFDNKFLYQNALHIAVSTVLSECNFRIHNISRMDVCIDFTTFIDIRRPETLIRKFASNTVRKLTKSKFTISGMHIKKNSFEYIRFGSRTSNICYYMYNKTREMAEIKLKPWIQDLWKLNNMVGKSDVWRLEFSINNLNQSIFSKKTGEINIINSINIFEDNNYVELLNALICKYFRFKCGKIKSNVSRMNELCLFPQLCEKKNLKYVSFKMESSRSDKIFIKKLVQMNNEMRNSKIENSLVLQECTLDYAKARNMCDFLKKCESL
jgi:hypothetical protein